VPLSWRSPGGVRIARVPASASSATWPKSFTRIEKSAGARDLDGHLAELFFFPSQRASYDADVLAVRRRDESSRRLGLDEGPQDSYLYSTFVIHSGLLVHLTRQTPKNSHFRHNFSAPVWRPQVDVNRKITPSCKFRLIFALIAYLNTACTEVTAWSRRTRA